MSEDKAKHVVAFARVGEDGCSVTVVPRLGWTASGGDIDVLLDAGCWGDTRVLLPDRLAASAWQDVIAARPVRPDGAALPVAELLQQLPVAVLRSLPG